ncbi:hypothetical protein GO613_20880 [Azoarcus communis]|uniref:hypothetical protein n=1 Tax=Parazoarcus communis TaxID=41977 RepID=UPI00145991EE|nr:hypothetical protein [Parazoarcus communis]NMG50555.1 hypothetical protein [Parazoarcus communis]
MEQNREQIETLIENARQRRSQETGPLLVSALQATVKWLASLGKSVRDGVRAGHGHAAHN